MERRDLPKGTGGWQIVDATPQEKSQGFYKCGPASQYAIKEGYVDYQFDTGFVFAEVNADRIYYYQKPNGGFRIGRIDSQTVGRNISTKAVGSNRREDITSEYKYPDNSAMEKIIQSRIAHRRKHAGEIVKSPVSITLSLPNVATIQQECYADITLTNQSNQTAKLKFRVICQSVSNRGTVNATLLSQMYETELKGLEVKKFKETISSRELLKYVRKDYAFLKVEATGMANGEHFLHAEATAEIDPPHIVIKGIQDRMSVGTRYMLEASFINPYDYTLTDTKIYLTGDAVPNGRLKIFVGNLASGLTFKEKFNVYSSSPGERFLYASLQANEASGFEKSVGISFSS